MWFLSSPPEPFFFQSDFSQTDLTFVSIRQEWKEDQLLHHFTCPIAAEEAYAWIQTEARECYLPPGIHIMGCRLGKTICQSLDSWLGSKNSILPLLLNPSSYVDCLECLPSSLFQNRTFSESFSPHLDPLEWIHHLPKTGMPFLLLTFLLLLV